jgi:hypothetical protein
MIKNRFASEKRRKTFLDDIWQTLMLEIFLSSESRAMLCISYAESRQKISEGKKRQGVRKKGEKRALYVGSTPPNPL